MAYKESLFGREADKEAGSEKTEDQVLFGAVETVEIKDAAAADASGEHTQEAEAFFERKAREFFSPKENWGDVKKYGSLVGVGISIAARMIYGLGKLAWKIVTGKATFGEGYKIIKETVSFDSKKEK